jgi:hypothetical protein
MFRTVKRNHRQKEQQLTYQDEPWLKPSSSAESSMARSLLGKKELAFLLHIGFLPTLLEEVGGW